MSVAEKEQEIKNKLYRRLSKFIDKDTPNDFSDAIDDALTKIKELEAMREEKSKAEEMIFVVYKTSLHTSDEKPIEEAFQINAKRLFTKKWSRRKIWVIKLKSPKELLELAKKYETIIIDTKPFTEYFIKGKKKFLPEIEIYDDYRE